MRSSSFTYALGSRVSKKHVQLGEDASAQSVGAAERGAWRTHRATTRRVLLGHVAFLNVAVPSLPTVTSLRAEWREANAAARNRRRTVYLQRKEQASAL